MLPEVVLRVAFASVGFGPHFPGRGLEGTKDIVRFMIATAEACRKMQDAQVDATIGGAMSNPTGGALVVCRHYDATPWTIRFGRLQSKLAPYAR